MRTQPAIHTLQIAAGDYKEMVRSADKVISTFVNNSELVPPKSAADYVIFDRAGLQLNCSFRLWARLRIERGRCSLGINLGSDSARCVEYKKLACKIASVFVRVSVQLISSKNLVSKVKPRFEKRTLNLLKYSRSNALEIFYIK